MKRKAKLKEFNRLPKQELLRILLEKKEQLRQLRFDLIGGKVKNVREIRVIKRDIARLLTLLKQQKQK